MPALGDYVYVYWNVGTSYGLAGTVTGEEFTTRLSQIIDAGYGALTTKPATSASGSSLVSIPTRVLSKAEADQIYVSTALVPDKITYNSDGTVASSVEGGVTTTYTWNTDGTINTETKLGFRKTWVYTNGLPTSSTVQAV